KTVRIVRIKVFGERHFMKVYTHIDEDRTHFDIYVSLLRRLGSNYLIMNFNLRLKSEGATDFQKIIDMKGVNFCKFLMDPLLQNFFRSEILLCPVKIGNYSIMRLETGKVIDPHVLSRGTYKFFVEIVEATGEIPKVFAMQVISQIT
ncbi:GH14245, partial [Drosophila grimshawi]